MRVRDIDDRLKVVKLAEIDCETHAKNAHAAWRELKSTAKHAATPWRIVTVGAISGFLMGRSGGGAAGGSSVGAKLFGTVAQALITTLGAGATAGAAASSAADAAAIATSDAVAEGSTPVEARVQAAKAADIPTAETEATLHEDA
jgi:TctA family transporter